MKSSVRPLAIIMISLFGFFLIITHYTNKSDLEYSGREMLEIVQSADYTISSDSVSDLEDISLIDIREPELFLVSSREGAINIPLSSLLDDANEEFFKSESTKVIISDDQANAHEAWMLLTQLGYKHLLVLDQELTN